MRNLKKIPGLSFTMLLVGYGAFGWLLSIHHADWRIWATSGAIAFASASLFAIAWAIAAIVFVFATSKALVLSIGICLVWAMLMYIARLEIMAALGKPSVQNFFVLLLIATAALGMGWGADIALIPSFGKSLMLK